MNSLTEASTCTCRYVQTSNTLRIPNNNNKKSWMLLARKRKDSLSSLQELLSERFCAAQAIDTISISTA